MLKLTASYSKKVPAEGEYTSQSYHASLEVELSDALAPEQIQERIHSTFTQVREAVESELHGARSEGRDETGTRSKSDRQVAPQPANSGKASNKQIKFVTDLASRRGLSLSDLNTRITKRFGVPGLYDLTRGDASQLVDELKKAA